MAEPPAFANIDAPQPEFVTGDVARRAWRFAAAAHAGQTRRSDGSPYIRHPVAVARLVDEHGGDEAMVAAAFLHDVLEDTEVGRRAVVAEFGEDVGSLVIVLSDNPRIEDYERRKTDLREQVEAAGSRAIMIYACDKLTNAATLRRVYAVEGEASARRHKTSLGLRVAIWRGDLEMARRRLGEVPPLPALEAELDAIEAARDGRGGG